MNVSWSRNCGDLRSHVKLANAREQIQNFKGNTTPNNTYLKQHPHNVEFSDSSDNLC